ncbi:MAG: hypothetical protein JW751_20410 [Polyangiaceae bacterium]|nr:hypothetical protein [Polyangiaceae bacterium]
MRTGSRVTEGCATVDARAEENGNTRLAVRVRGLAPAASFAPDSTVYVVWTQSQDGTKQNVGALGLSGDREGTLDTTTSHRKSLVMVTPEPSGEVRSPPTNGSSPSTSSDLTPDVGPTAELTERRRLQGTSGPNATPRPS